MEPTFERLTGRTHDHVVRWGESTWVHRSARDNFSLLVEQARSDGFQLSTASSFRSYSSQQSIWNNKARGKRSLLDASGEPLVFEDLTADEVVHAILRWSALPGASRHHWGTEIDVFPQNLVGEGEGVELIPQEIAPGGKFEAFGRWLDESLPLHGFYRPYREDRGGVSPEWWHLSYAPIAEGYLQNFTLELFERSLKEGNLELKTEVLSQSRAIYERYVTNVAPAPKAVP